MAKDANGNELGLGDYVIPENSGIVRIVKLSESTKEIKATGAYVEMAGNGRVGRLTFNPARARLVMKSDGALVEIGPIPYANTLKREEAPAKAATPAPEGGAATTKTRPKNA